MTTYLNTYAPPKPSYADDVHLHTKPEEYDLNFQLTAQPIRVLEGEGRDVRLEPFIVSPRVLQTALEEDAPSFPFGGCVCWTECLGWGGVWESGRKAEEMVSSTFGTARAGRAAASPPAQSMPEVQGKRHLCGCIRCSEPLCVWEDTSCSRAGGIRTGEPANDSSSPPPSFPPPALPAEPTRPTTL